MGFIDRSTMENEGPTAFFGVGLEAVKCLIPRKLCLTLFAKGVDTFFEI